jgi:TRAP-type mannitol/chloroaromatic compound transport system substrate-binding protein
LLLVFAAVFPAMASDVRLQVQSAFALRSAGLGTTIAWTAEKIKEASQGSIQFNLFEPGKLVPAFEVLDAVSTGKIQAGYACANYWQGKMPSAPLFGSVPFGPTIQGYLAWLYHGNGMKLYQELYDQSGYNVKVLVCGILGPDSGGWFSKPVETPADLKGLKMRIAGFGGNTLQKMGVSVSLIPIGEAYSALEKGAIDAVEIGSPAIDKPSGVYKVAKYNYFPGWHQPSTIIELLINKTLWNKLSKQQQSMIEMACNAATLEGIAYGESLQGPIMKENASKHGVINRRWSKTMLAAINASWLEVVAEMKVKDPYFKKVWEDMENFFPAYNYWEAYGSLPTPEPTK